METIAKLRPALKTHGGKAYLARRIVRRLPDHRIYVEPYAGGLSVLLNKPAASLEVAGDIDPDLTGFYRILTSRTEELLERIADLDYSLETFQQACDPSDDPLESAVRFLVRHRFSRGGLGRTFAWSERLRGGRPGDLNAWETFKELLPRIASRLIPVRWRTGEALEVIREFDRPETLFYLDPPYVHETRTAKRAYDAYEMTLEDHGRLLETIRQVRGRVAISGYGNPLYDQALEGWDRHTFEMPNHSGQGRSKNRRTEVLWVKSRG
jgi:DNA adenine methylase